MTDCLFCKIVAGEVPSQELAESDHFYAFLDINPINEGHALVVPKEHSEHFLDLSSEHGEEFIEFAQSVARAVKSATGADAFNIGLNSGRAAGQVIFHTHFHIIPRFDDDGLSTWPGHEADDDALGRLAEKIRKEL